MKIIFIVIEFKDVEELDALLFSEVMRLGKTKNIKKVTPEHRPKIFIQHGNSSCHQEIIEELEPLLPRHNITLISVDGACETIVHVLEYLNNVYNVKNNLVKSRISNLHGFLINPCTLIDKNAKSSNVLIKHYFSDCNDVQALKLKDCINSKKNSETTADIVWIPIANSPLKATYSITLLKELFYKNNSHTL